MNIGGEGEIRLGARRSSETTTGEATMKTVLAAISVMVLMTVAFAGAPQHAVGAGNGAPSGPHYNLNIIGVPKDKSADMTGDNGHRIFVDLGKKDGAAVTTRILLSQSFDGSFEVLDANGTDGEASFKLPAPGTYTVWARARGTPGGSATMTTCAQDPIDPTALICSLENEVFVRGTGPGNNQFKNVTDALTTIVLAAGSDAALACGSTQVSLFDPCLNGFLWQYDNNGLKLLQVRFYY